MQNDELFQQYENKLKLKLKNARNLANERKLLLKFKKYINGFPPSPELAKAFLTQYILKPSNTIKIYNKS